MIEKVLERYGADMTRVREFGWRPLRCPFHDDRTASASVNLEKDAFICHACGVKGSAITLIMQRESLDYNAAREWAESVLGAGVEHLPRATEKPRRKPSRWRRRLFDIT